MRFKRWLASAAVATAALTGLATAASATAQAAPIASSAACGATSLKGTAPIKSVTLPASESPACATPAPGHVTCATLIPHRSSLSTAAHAPDTAAAPDATPTGWSPSNLQSAYDLPTSMNSGATVAVVTAYGDTVTPGPAPTIAWVPAPWVPTSAPSSGRCLQAIHTISIEATGKETRGAGTASATVQASLKPADGADETLVSIHTSLNVTGRPVQFGRSLLPEVSGHRRGNRVAVRRLRGRKS